MNFLFIIICFYLFIYVYLIVHVYLIIYSYLIIAKQGILPCFAFLSLSVHFCIVFCHISFDFDAKCRE